MITTIQRRKAYWQKTHQPNILRAEALNPNIGPGIRYSEKLNKLVSLMCHSVEEDIFLFFNKPSARAYFALDESISETAKGMVERFTKRFTDLFDKYASPYANSMVEDVSKQSSIAVTSSIRSVAPNFTIPKSTISAAVKDIIAVSAAENVNLIKSIAAKYLDGVSQAVYRSITTGNGLQDLIPYLKKHEKITHRRAQLIALDQNRKVFNNLAAERMKSIGVDEYEWLHSGGSDHPRKDHIEMSGNIYKLTAPPIIDPNTGERGIPGQLINCRCRMRPIVKFDGVEWNDDDKIDQPFEVKFN